MGFLCMVSTVCAEEEDRLHCYISFKSSAAWCVAYFKQRDSLSIICVDKIKNHLLLQTSISLHISHIWKRDSRLKSQLHQLTVRLLAASISCQPPQIASAVSKALSARVSLSAAKWLKQIFPPSMSQLWLQYFKIKAQKQPRKSL